MVVIPLIVGRTIVTTEEAFQVAGARDGECLLVRGFDHTQLSIEEPGDSNLSYDLRVGAEYIRGSSLRLEKRHIRQRPHNPASG